MLGLKVLGGPHALLAELFFRQATSQKTICLMIMRSGHIPNLVLGAVVDVFVAAHFRLQDVITTSPTRAANDFPEGWHSEKFTVVDAHRGFVGGDGLGQSAVTTKSGHPKVQILQLFRVRREGLRQLVKGIPSRRLFLSRGHDLVSVLCESYLRVS